MEPTQSGMEWLALQHDHERLELAALAIKLVAVVLATLGMALPWPTVALLAPLPILWLQEGILRTSQARLGARLLRIEADLVRGSTRQPFRLHSEWQATRPGTIGLVREYIRNSLRPTVAFPYVVLIAVAAIT